MRSSFILVLEGIFIWIICMVELGLKFGGNRTSGYWGIPFFIFEVFFHWRLSYLKYFYSLLWSHELKSKIEEYWTSGYCNFPFLIFEVFFHHMYYWRLSVWSQKLKFKFCRRFDQYLLRYYIYNIWVLLPLFHWRSSPCEILL